MEFDRLLSYFERDGQKEIVALVSYYAEEYMGQETITISEIRDVIEGSRTSISRSNISTYCRRLQNDDLLTTAGDDGYRLTHQGLEYVRNHIEDGVVEESRDELFIDTNIVEDSFYQQLIMDINECYRIQVDSASLVLTRKLFENLIVDILRWHYGMDNIEMFFDPDQGYHHGLSRLKRNLRENISEFRMYSRDIDEDLLDELDQFRESGDASAHSVIVNVSDEEVEGMAHDATQLTNVLYDIRRGVRYANETE